MKRLVGTFITRSPSNNLRDAPSMTVYRKTGPTTSVTATLVVQMITFACKDAILQTIVRNNRKLRNQDVLHKFVCDDIKLEKSETWTLATTLNYETPSLLTSRAHKLSTASLETTLLLAQTRLQRRKITPTCIWWACKLRTRDRSLQHQPYTLFQNQDATWPFPRMRAFKFNT